MQWNKIGNKTRDSSIACLTCSTSISPGVLAAGRKTCNHQRPFSLLSALTLNIHSPSAITMAVALQFLSGFYLCLGYLQSLCLILFNGQEPEASCTSLYVPTSISVHFSHLGRILCTLTRVSLSPLSMSVSAENRLIIYTDRSNREYSSLRSTFA